MTTSGRMWPTPRAEEASHPGRVQIKDGQQMHLSAAALTSSPEAFPASPSLPPESDRAHAMTAISGRNLRELWEPSGPVGAFLRMCRESSVWRVGLTGYSLTWTRAATPAGRSLYRLRLSVPRTDGIGCGLWATPRAIYGEHPGMRDESHLTGQVQMWATPRVEGFDAGKHRGQADSLHSQVKALPTPCSRDHRTGMADRAGDERHTQNLPERIAAEMGVKSAKLSAAWVTRLMGYPDGYLDDLPSDPLGKTDVRA